MRASWGWWVACVLTGSAGCAHAPRDPCTSSPSGAWIRLESPNFSIVTDLPARIAESVIREFEETRQIVFDLAFHSSDPPTGETELIIGAAESSLAIQRPANVGAFFRQSRGGSKPAIVVLQGASPLRRATMAHEMVHRFVAHHIPQAPPWLNEGLAQFWATARLSGDRAILGEPTFCSFPEGPYEAVGCSPLDIVPDTERLSVAELVASSQKEFYGRSRVIHYVGSWALVRTLYQPQWRAAFGRLQRRLTEGALFEEAWTELLAEVPLEEIEDAYRAHFAYRAEFERWPVRYERPEVAPQIRQRALTPTEVHVLRARFSSWRTTEDQARVQQELEEARNHDPSSHLPPLWRGRLAWFQEDRAAARAHFEDSLRLAPATDVESRFMLAQLLLEELEAKTPAPWFSAEDLAKAVKELARRAHDADSLNLVGWYHALQGQAAAGMPFALRAVREAPDCSDCWDTLALLRYRYGDTTGALQAQERAIAAVTHRAPHEDLLRRLETYRNAVRAKPTPEK